MPITNEDLLLLGWAHETRCMRRLVFCAMLCFGWLTDSKAQPRISPSPVTMSGVVINGSGSPIGDVNVDHTGSRSGLVKTDRQGRFEIATRAPAVVFRKSGFQSRYVRVEDGKTVGLSVRMDGPVSQARECGAQSNCYSVKYFGASFCLPKIRGVNVTKQGNDIDYGQRVFWIAAPDGKVGVQLAAGGMWGSGLPLDEEVWTAASYSETDYRDIDGFPIIDARGMSIDGRRWRILGHAFESATYRGVPEQDAVLLDRLLDGACVKPRLFPETRR